MQQKYFYFLFLILFSRDLNEKNFRKHLKKRQMIQGIFGKKIGVD